MKLRVSVIIPAAGSSKRMNPAPARTGGIKGFGKRKPFILLDRRPVISHTLNVFNKISAVKEIILVVNRKDLNAARRRFDSGRIKVIEGGSVRSVSVYNGLKAVDKNCNIVLIHDAVRPLVTKDLVMRSVRAALRFGAAVVAVPAIATIKKQDKGGFVASTLDRSLLWEAQTPQAFKKDLIVKAFKRFRRFRGDITDDAMLVEKMGHRVKLVLGSYKNIKITTPDDLIIAMALFKNV